MRTIYLSPHLDDAIISAGGLIRAQADSGMRVEIWTFMAGYPPEGEPTPFAQLMHHIWGFADGTATVRGRRAEDANAAALAGATPVYFDFLDCIYRRGAHGEPLYSDITLPIQPDDAGLPGRISQAIASRIGPEDTIVSQLAIGRHVDHTIVRKAAEMLGRPLVYIADMPYVLNHPDELAPAVEGMQRRHESISEAYFGCWVDAISCYASQVDAVFGSREAMHESMEAFWQEQGGIDLWTAPGPS